MAISTIRRALHSVFEIATNRHPKSDSCEAFTVQSVALRNSNWAAILESYTHDDGSFDFHSATIHAREHAKIDVGGYPNWFVVIKLDNNTTNSVKFFLSPDQARELHRQLSPIVGAMELDEMSDAEFAEMRTAELDEMANSDPTDDEYVNPTWNSCPF